MYLQYSLRNQKFKKYFFYIILKKLYIILKILYIILKISLLYWKFPYYIWILTFWILKNISKYYPFFKFGVGKIFILLCILIIFKQFTKRSNISFFIQKKFIISLNRKAIEILIAYLDFQKLWFFLIFIYKNWFF